MIIEVGDRFVARLGNPEDEHVSAEHPTAAIVPFKRGLEQLLSNNEEFDIPNFSLNVTASPAPIKKSPPTQCARASSRGESRNRSPTISKTVTKVPRAQKAKIRATGLNITVHQNVVPVQCVQEECDKGLGQVQSLQYRRGPPELCRQVQGALDLQQMSSQIGLQQGRELHPTL
ncbi:Hypothetical predicted protein [Cloeon dipterum]|uniref:Uncharacterized protein n=1 Tax=Cloeon dipterum TaxID=197152 RepID=A0A8S1E032_9INSE|nr:Hypothetical predicted protein [Cloeon dipterum]